MSTQKLLFRWLFIFIATWSMNVTAQNWPVVNGSLNRSNYVDINLHPPFQITQTYALEGKCGGMTFYNGNLYTSAGNGAESWIKAFDATSADLLWTFTIPGARASASFVPAVSDSIVLAAAQWGKGLYALNRFTGDSIWSVPLIDLHARMPVIENHKVYIVEDQLYCFDLQTGQEIWAYPLVKRIVSSPAIDGQNIYFLERDSIRALNKENGQVIWRSPARISSFPSLAYNDQFVFVGSHDYLYALDKQDGSIKWSQYYDGIWISDNVGGAMALVDTILLIKLYLPPDGPFFYSAVHTDDGHLIWTKNIPSKTYQSPTILKDIFIDAHFSEEALMTYDLYTGDLIDQFDLGVMRGAEPIVADGLIYVGAGDHIYALAGKTTGSLSYNSTENLKINLYPNPVFDQLNITVQPKLSEPLYLEIMDIQGNVILKDNKVILSNGNHQYSIYLSDLTSGVYFLNIQTGAYRVTRKLIKL